MRTLVAAVAALVILTPPAAADPRIVGGTVVESIDEYPFVAALLDRNGVQFCGGALIGRNRVLTAAHCTVGLTPEHIQVVVGRLDLTTDDGIVSKVRRITNHPEYESAEEGHDIAWLTTEVEFPHQYEPAELPDEADKPYAPGGVGTVIGWGRIVEGGPASSQLREVDVPVQPDANCKDHYPTYDKRFMFCAGLPDGGADSCQGDSGGPFLVQGKVVGIVSWGVGCGRPGSEGVYTRVKYYL